MRAILLFLCLIPALLFAQTEVKFEVFQSGQQSNVQTEQFHVFQTEGQFQTYWKASTGEANAPRDVKWATEFLIAVNLGNKSSGGYKVFIESIERVRGELVVTVVELMPSGATTQAITSPWEIVKVQRTSGNIKFNKIKRQNPSGNFGQIGGGWDRSSRWRTFSSEISGGGPRSREVTIQNAVEFREYWKSISEEECPVNEVDWKQEMLVAIHLGNQSSTGYNVLVETVEMARDGIVVSYVKQVPASGQKVSRSRTSPYVIVRVPRASRVYFNSRTWASEG